MALTLQSGRLLCDERFLGLHGACGETHAGCESILESLDGGKANMFDLRQCRLIPGEEHHLRSPQGGIPGGVNQVYRCFNQPDSRRALDPQIISERTREMDPFKIPTTRPEAIEQQTESC